MQSFPFKFSDDLVLYIALHRMTEHVEDFYEGPKRQGQAVLRQENCLSLETAPQAGQHMNTPFQKGRGIDVCLYQLFFSTFYTMYVVIQMNSDI